MRCVLREVRDEDLAVLFEHTASSAWRRRCRACGRRSGGAAAAPFEAFGEEVAISHLMKDDVSAVDVTAPTGHRSCP
jgi:hypothetical protein